MPNLPREQRIAIKELSLIRDVVILPADKGNAKSGYVEVRV